MTNKSHILVFLYEKLIICDRKKGGEKMRLMYLKPRLKELSQESRIAFVRQFRQITQNELADKLNGERKRRAITNYEKGIRTPKDDRLFEISNRFTHNLL